jgi:OOP family OmpA-OmpF porin
MKKQILLACVLGAFALPVMADNFYVFGDVGQSTIAFDANDGFTNEKSDKTYSLGAGYEFNQFFAVELAYRDLGNVTSRDSYTQSGVNYNDTYKTSAAAYQASVVASLPISDVLKIYGRLGLAEVDLEYDDSSVGGGIAWEKSSTQSGTKGLFGLGASYDVSSQIALRAEYSQYSKFDDIKLSALTVGAAYTF